MPIYEYECRRCGHRFELIQGFSDKPRQRCPECSGKVDRLISSSAIRFKGTGWYVTDYGGKGKEERAEAAGDTAGAEGSDASEKAEKAEAKKQAKKTLSDKGKKENKKAS
jgi:putative FmdB family regulatory protein